MFKPMRLVILFDIFVKNDGYGFLIRLDLILSMSLSKRVPIVINFKQPFYQTFN